MWWKCPSPYATYLHLYIFNTDYSLLIIDEGDTVVWSLVTVLPLYQSDAKKSVKDRYIDRCKQKYTWWSISTGGAAKHKMLQTLIDWEENGEN